MTSPLKAATRGVSAQPDPPFDLEDLLDVPRMAGIFRTTPQGIYNARHQGNLPPAFRVSGRLLWSRREVAEWLQTRRDEPSVSA